MKPKKTKTGRWSVQVYVGRSADGKKIVKSFTADTKAEVMRKANAFHYNGGTDMTVGDAVMLYIETRAPVLSPTSYRGYISIYNGSIKDYGIAEFSINRLNDLIVQKWISAISRAKSPKTVKNAYGLFSAAVNFFCPRTYFNVKLPQNRKPALHTPTTAEVDQVLAYCKEHNYELYKAVILSAVCMMRQGEIVALTADDVDRDRCRISITKSLARTIDNQFVIKPPKTEASTRVISVPQFVIDMLPEEGKLVDMNPRYISLAFSRAVRKACKTPFRFHDLRHYAASIAASSSVGASAETIKARGGWATDSVMKRVYINNLADEMDKDTSNINNYYGERFGNERK